MTTNSIRLAAVAAMTAAGMLLVPAAASAHSPSEQMMSKMRGHTTMTDVLGAHPELADMRMAGMDMGMGMGMGMGAVMATRMRGHATMADVLRAHPELADMNMAGMDMSEGSGTATTP